MATCAQKSKVLVRIQLLDMCKGEFSVLVAQSELSHHLLIRGWHFWKIIEGGGLKGFLLK